MTQTGQSIGEGLKILDFGLAKIKSGELLGSFVQAKTSGLMGSPFYMAPEQWSDEEPDARADIYSMGIILYQMLSGDVPFKGASIPAIMKKHLTQSPPSFQSVGVDVAPRIEAVVYHALEKDPADRIPTVDAFIAELRAAVAAEGSTMRAGRQTLSPDLGQTLVEHSPDTAAIPPQTTSETAFDSMAGTVSSAALSPEEQEKISASRIAYEREQQEKDRVAREELAREADARRKSQEEKERQRKEQEERIRKEKEEREERERQQREQMERVERQARELEERLAKLATSMPPSQATVADLEATQVHQGASSPGVANSLPGVASSLPRTAPRLEVSLPPKPKSNSLMMIGVISLVVLLVGGAATAYFVSRSRSTTGVGPNGTNPTPSPTVGTETRKPDMVQIPGGTFQMGRNDGARDFSEFPAHPEKVQPFFMDKTEVTNAEYEDFVLEKNYQWPEDWKGPKAPHGRSSYPVSNVSFEDANAFAAWRSNRDGVTYRLPTEQEWEYAARNGDRSNLFPWGNDWKENAAVLNQSDAEPVGSRPAGKNIWGVEDLLGNVWEWTSSKLSAYPGNTGTVPEGLRNRIIFRGAGYTSNPTNKAFPMSSCVRSADAPTFKTGALGFRLVRSG
jgi:formylglycine-generating enzyme required for sulfatase activity